MQEFLLRDALADDVPIRYEGTTGGARLPLRSEARLIEQ